MMFTSLRKKNTCLIEVKSFFKGSRNALLDRKNFSFNFLVRNVKKVEKHCFCPFCCKLAKRHSMNENTSAKMFI